MKRFGMWLGAAVLAAGLATPLVEVSASSASAHPTYALGSAKKCKVDYVKRTETHVVSVRVKVHDNWTTKKVSQRYVACVWSDPVPVKVFTSTAPTITTVTTAPTSTTTAPAGNTGSPVTTTLPPTTIPPVPALGVNLDPSFVQGNTPSTYLNATYSFSASASLNGLVLQSLPTGVLDFYSDGLLACSINVGGASGSGQCPVAYTTYGTHTVATIYVSGTNSATTGVENESIVPPPITVNDTFGTTSPTNNITAAVQATGPSAAVTVTDPNWEGATQVGVTDNLGDTCTASITGTHATCSMTITGTPTSITVSYPGGTPTLSTQNLAPNGVQSVTTDWPAVSGISVHGASLTVQVNTATVSWSSWAVQGSGSGSSLPPNPINTSVSHYVHLFVSTTGNVSPDNAICDFGQQLANQEPCGYLVFTVTGGTEGVDFTESNEYTGSSDCSQSQNFTGQAEGGCSLTFNTPGTYSVSVEYISDFADSNYANTNLPSVEQVHVS